MIEYGHFIGGKRVAGTSGRKQDVMQPMDGSVRATVALASAQELLTAFIGLEMSSISSYVLAGYRRDSVKSSESAVKYFLLGSFATAFFLYGIALVYGASGSTNLVQIASADTSSNIR